MVVARARDVAVAGPGALQGPGTLRWQGQGRCSGQDVAAARDVAAAVAAAEDVAGTLQRQDRRQLLRLVTLQRTYSLSEAWEKRDPNIIRD